MTTYLVKGFKREDHVDRFGTKVSVTSDIVRVIVDGPESGLFSPHRAAEKIAGPGYCFSSAMNINEHVPDDCKNVLMTEMELYERVPALNPRARRSRGRRHAR